LVLSSVVHSYHCKVQVGLKRLLDNDEVGLKSGKIHREGPFGMSKSKIHKMANNAF
jgi:hypothetical protein